MYLRDFWLIFWNRPDFIHFLYGFVPCCFLHGSRQDFDFCMLEEDLRLANKKHPPMTIIRAGEKAIFASLKEEGGSPPGNQVWGLTRTISRMVRGLISRESEVRPQGWARVRRCEGRLC